MDDDIVIAPAAELIRWLDTATRGLGNLAKERIAEEIGAHHHAAYEAALEDGVTIIEAERRAVESLGDSNRARREFRKVYLTHRDEKSVQGIMKIVHRPRWLRTVAVLGGMYIVSYCIYDYYFGKELGEKQLVHFVVQGTFFMLFGPLLGMQARLLRERRIRKAMGRQVALLVAFVGAVTLLPSWLFFQDGRGLFISLSNVCGLLFMIWAWSAARTVRKLPRELSESEWEILQRKPDPRDTFMGRWGRW